MLLFHSILFQLQRTVSLEPEFCSHFMGEKPEVTAIQLRILPMLQLLFTKTNQSKPELWSCGFSLVLCGCVKSTLHNNRYTVAMCGGRVEGKSNHKKILTCQIKKIIKRKLRKVMKDIPPNIEC
jgi:hypothetical protein